MRIRLRNDGWAAPFNPRPVELVLRHTTTGQTYPFDLPVDPRYWLADGDATHVINHDVLTPSDLPSGGYEMLLNLPDPAPLLYGISAYSIRFANAGVWEDITGFNNLLHTVTVVSTNRAPFLTTDNDGVTVDEGRPATNTGTVGDDDDDQVTLSASVGTAINNGDGTWSWSFPTTDGPTESQTVTISADDGKGGTAQAIFALAVNNVAPTVETIALPVVPVAIKDQTSFNIDVTFRDPAGAADEPYTCDFDLDNDGTVDQTVSNVAGATCNTPLAYAGPGVYTVKVTVTDINGGSGSKTATEFVVIYDPEGGFVTGGGWIISLAAACPDFCGGATGKANFGFVSKYKKGASTPTGETEFQFKAGNLRFRSDSYDWLVVAGPTAKYKGQGTVNGRGDFGFMLTATDEELTPSADVDLFRIKIWDMDTDAVIYDNQWGEGDDSNAGTAIQGGSIVVHKPK